jgi:hypothetical protein
MVLKLLHLYSQETILSMEKITMRSLVVAIGLGASLFLFSGQADAQYKYTDDKGVSKVTQYKLDIPEPYRDAAVWVGPTGIGKPGLSKEAEQTKLRDDAYRRIGEADAQLIPYKRRSLSGFSGRLLSCSASRHRRIRFGSQMRCIVSYTAGGKRMNLTERLTAPRTVAVPIIDVSSPDLATAAR